jgi:hypothetical protein
MSHIKPLEDQKYMNFAKGNCMIQSDSLQTALETILSIRDSYMKTVKMMESIFIP